MLLKGAPAANCILATIKDQIQSHSGAPGLAVVLVENTPASEIYVSMKVKRATDLGMVSRSYRKPSDATLSDILALIHQLNCDEDIHGILVQLPLPKHLDTQAILSAISPDKDVDGLHPTNVGKLLLGETDGFVPCTPAGIVELLKYYEISLYGKHVVILGRSNIVGKPLAALLMQKHADTNASVTVLHSQSEHLSEITRTADILVSAIGVPLFVTREMISEKTIVIDVGTSRIPAANPKGYSLAGDVDFNNVAPVCQAITPVPGGVGPMTVALLMRNTWESFSRHTC
ncbi:methylenetetrahydrofolate dehydrogenase/methenyltetrahydrofolate cyclohydrolase,Bifunctional protein FolD,bifunctional 5,10-methylene-tetrahydrofolate dehydrogenase/ 5,10-methylene-tetrahydrofolate cyclohydrolase,Tetrahydrofolate dehydrogenase/cyclohydrolase, NAD(P)-binding domain [Chlamydia suis]|uniref:bifunctional methylenetetrahydrofolate dehydrogenase/methenyltetrahydrofolate cyclohydrolase FolD n=1 Tax=Chlamydia suis TaxID=83559 RepID=UPI0009B11B83|nr:bifunctional methylenetetrahydrofolate dehydrogenase/methenyltetrahydrofolate cyclohydrolase FolD [Chlamydia suis]SIU03099.1 methylenetetrahydrofolate dehydrogenase/methenyltetrahydrofolate cyclohydrolase,Bifunctional protein FolD,bifunctional 5,10-methylene-tetrahydrofolate dehydrogenase/ 5,10-methylene-tetrahydrofolate cyclohydrolase,Tetrahydrofolate dehydrogenase/cyclohydrolase, NAD(P)-binding domain [Chlamydia suis]